MTSHYATASTLTSTRTGTGPVASASRTAELIARNGYVLVSDGFDQATQGAGYTYTVGLSVNGLPELVVTGLAPLLAARLTQRVAEQALTGDGFAFDQRQWLGDAALVVLQVSKHWLSNDPSRMAAWFAHTRNSGRRSTVPQVAQIVWGDQYGRFPGDPACNPYVAEDQPIIAHDPFGFPRRRSRSTKAPRPLRLRSHAPQQRSA